MIIAIGSDHAGAGLKNELRDWLKGLNFVHAVHDLHGTSGERTDYPLASFAVGEMVARGEADFGVLVCGSGVGVAIAANKVPGIRAVCAADVTTARLAREHNDCNVVTVGERLTGPLLAREIVETFLATAFAGDRHSGRVELIRAYEARHAACEERKA